MPTQGVIARLLASPADRQLSRDLALVERSADLAEAVVEGIARIQGRALYTTMQLNMLRLQAERAAPDGAELYAMIAVAGAMEMTNVISRMNRAGRGL